MRWWRWCRKRTSTGVGVFLAALRYTPDISTRKVDDLVQSMGMSGISKSQVSRLCSELDEQVNGFLERPLTGEWAYVWFDATYVKSRSDGRVVSRAIVVAVGVHGGGRREILGVSVGPAETEAFWTAFIRSLVARGLAGVRLVISDAHVGLKKAVQQVLGATWQRCRVHFMRNALAHVPRKQHQMVAPIIRTALVQESQDDAISQWREVAERLRGKYPKLGDLMDDAEQDVLAFMSFPKEHWKQIASTNPLERINKEIKRRTNVVGIFPNDDAITRLVGALAHEQSDEWQVTRTYMSHESLQRALAPTARQASLPGDTPEKVA